MAYDYQETPKLSEEFKSNPAYYTNGKIETITASGLTVLAHQKGIKKLDVNVLMYPTKDNGNTCVCKATVIGYGWNPITEKVEEVEFSDIGDANPTNCTPQTAKSFIRMASTRAISRTFRKYTDVDILCEEEMDINNIFFKPITSNQLSKIKALVTEKNIPQALFANVLAQKYRQISPDALSEEEGNLLIKDLETYNPGAQQTAQQPMNVNNQPVMKGQTNGK